MNAAFTERTARPGCGCTGRRRAARRHGGRSSDSDQRPRRRLPQLQQLRVGCLRVPIACTTTAPTRRSLVCGTPEADMTNRRVFPSSCKSRGCVATWALLDDANHQEAAGFADVLSFVDDHWPDAPTAVRCACAHRSPNRPPAANSHHAPRTDTARPFVHSLLSAAAWAAMELVCAAAAYGF